MDYLYLIIILSLLIASTISIFILIKSNRIDVVLDFILKMAIIAVNAAEQLYLSRQINKEERKTFANKFIKNVLIAKNINYKKYEELIDFVIEHVVLNYLNKKKSNL